MFAARERPLPAGLQLDQAEPVVIPRFRSRGADETPQEVSGTTTGTWTSSGPFRRL